jgi:hypothetical protein
MSVKEFLSIGFVPTYRKRISVLSIYARYTANIRSIFSIPQKISLAYKLNPAHRIYYVISGLKYAVRIYH